MEDAGQPTPGYWRWLGRLTYDRALGIQTSYRERVLKEGAPECLFLLEHEPVITLGRSANPGNVISSPVDLSADSIPIIRTSRGGDVTYHGPGQLVGYPVFRIRQGVRNYMRTMADAVRDVVLGFGVACEWRDDRPGLWVGDTKVCAFGVHVRSRVSMHGFALNVFGVKQGFSHIIPCGLADAKVASLEDLVSTPLSVIDVADKVPAAFARRFNMALLPLPQDTSEFP